MRHSVLVLVLGCAACSRDDIPVPPARAAEPEPSAVPKAEPEPPPSVSAAAFGVETDAGQVPAAMASRVLHVGDSMAPLVGNYLRPIYAKAGKKYWIETVVSSSTLDWSSKRLLQDAMYRYDPEVVIISLGSNELFDPTPERRAPAIRQIIEDTRGRPCLWIGPPLWKKDTGFIAVLKQNLGHCRYFDSAKLDLPRMPDGRHPNWNGGWHWANAVWHELGGTDAVPSGQSAPNPL